jgi:hypothetical protein
MGKRWEEVIARIAPLLNSPRRKRSEGCLRAERPRDGAPPPRRYVRSMHSLSASHAAKVTIYQPAQL